MEEQTFKELYDDRSLEIMKTAEDSWERGVDRLHEIKNFAREAGMKRIGIANCVSYPKETKEVTEFLSDEFEVYSVGCKCGHVTQHQMLGNDRKSLICNPAGQAEYLKDQNTELNISMGLCVGHDMIFNQKSAAPVTNLIVKDQTKRKSD